MAAVAAFILVSSCASVMTSCWSGRPNFTGDMIGWLAAVLLGADALLEILRADGEHLVGRGEAQADEIAPAGKPDAA